VLVQWYAQTRKTALDFSAGFRNADLKLDGTLPNLRSGTMTSTKLLDMLNRAIAGELQAITQYMWQHVQWKGIEHYAVSEGIKEIAIGEMKHAEKIAERLWYLRGKPTTQPNPIFVGDKLEEMINFDIKAELEAIALYKEIMEQAQKEGDVATKEIFEEIEAEEEEHHDFFTSLLEK
jgi:bacterioferritin